MADLPFQPLAGNQPRRRLAVSSIPTAKLGRTGIDLPRLGLGCAGLGELFEPVDENEAEALLTAATDRGIRYFDTAPWYGRGKSEHRVGRFLWDVPREKVILSTKVGRVLSRRANVREPIADQWIGGLPFAPRFDYTYDGILRSFEDSLQRLGIDSVDMLVIHDLDDWHHDGEAGVSAALDQLAKSGWRALEELREGGVVRAVGAGINLTGYTGRFLDLMSLDFFLVALRLTLLEHQVFVAEELPRLVRDGIGIVIGGVFSSGLGATGAVAGARFNYAPADPEILARCAAIEVICARHQVPLAAASLQFPLRLPMVASVIPGAVSARQVEEIDRWFRFEIPDALWLDLGAAGLISV